MGQAVQIVGALIILGAFIGNQRFRLSSNSVSYLLANAVGSGILAVVAAVGHDLGFLLLEGVWAIVSFLSLARLRRGGSPADTVS